MIPMQQAFDKITYLVGNEEILGQMDNTRSLPLFSDMVIDFLDCLSKKLMHSREVKKYPDVMAYAFWIRKKSLERASTQYMTGNQRIGRGMAFQIAPSNIPVQFAVSMTYALTAGNASVVRVSDKKFEQTEIICDAIRTILSDMYPDLMPYICIIRYAHDDEITGKLSGLCDIRMIWGGDYTIAAIRKTAVKARCLDIGFADRYSIAIFDSDFLVGSDSVSVANDFYNDTYFTDQNACSAPRIVMWMGSRISEAKAMFWDALENVVLKKYKMDAICSSEKLLTTALCAAKYPGIKEIKKTNLLIRIELPSLYNDIMELKGNCGYFYECNVKSIQSIVPLMKKECQTITYIGDIEREIRKVINENGVRGVDRIVPIGHAADITFVWDGLDLPNVLSRQIGCS